MAIHQLRYYFEAVVKTDVDHLYLRVQSSFEPGQCFWNNLLKENHVRIPLENRLDDSFSPLLAIFFTQSIDVPSDEG